MSYSFVSSSSSFSRKIRFHQSQHLQSPVSCISNVDAAPHFDAANHQGRAVSTASISQASSAVAPVFTSPAARATGFVRSYRTGGASSGAPPASSRHQAQKSESVVASAPTVDIMSSLRATVRRNPNYVAVVAEGRGADSSECKASSAPPAPQAAVVCIQEKSSCAADSTDWEPAAAAAAAAAATAATTTTTTTTKRQLSNSNGAPATTNRQSIRGAAVTASGARDTLI